MRRHFPGYRASVPVPSSGHNVLLLKTAEHRQNAHFVCLSK